MSQDNPPRPFNEAFSQHLVENDIKQGVVASRTGRTPSSVSRALTGKTSLSREEWEQLAEAARMSPTEFASLYFPQEIAREAEAYLETKDERGAFTLRQRVQTVIERVPQNAEEALYLAAEEVDWTIGAAAHIASTAVSAKPACLPVALYFYGRALQEFNLSHRAKPPLDAARRLAEESSGPSARLLPYVTLSLANLAIESDRIPEGIGLFDDVRERHEAGVLPLTDPRQLAHLYGFGTEARVLRAVQYGLHNRPGRSADEVFSKAASDLNYAISCAESAARPHWGQRFHATHGLVRVIRGDVDGGLLEIDTSASWFARSSRSPAETDSGAYILAIRALAHRLANRQMSQPVEAGQKEAARFARRDGIFVVMRLISLIERVAPIATPILLLVLMLAVPTTAFAGNGC